MLWHCFFQKQTAANTDELRLLSLHLQLCENQNRSSANWLCSHQKNLLQYLLAGQLPPQGFVYFEGPDLSILKTFEGFFWTSFEAIYLNGAV